MKLSSHEIAWLVLNAGFSESFEAPTMVAIVLATSGGETDYLEFTMTNDLQDQLHGLTALSSQKHQDQLDNWRDGATNLQRAFAMFKNSGRNFGHWEAYSNGKYKDFMPLAFAGVENPVKPLPNAALKAEENGDKLSDLQKRAFADSQLITHISGNSDSLSNAIAETSRILSEIRAVFRN